MEKILEKAKQLQDIIVAHRRYLHQNAEIGMDLPISTKYVMEKLTEMGYKPEEICKSGVKVVVGKKPGKTFLLRGDMDALPMKEEADIDFPCKNGNMHACGHDMHASMLLGAAQILKEYEDQLDGQVVLMFQPAEENLLGAKAMVDAGILENPKVDAAMMIHVFTGSPIPDGALMNTARGHSAASADWFTINIQGAGCHGAMPNTGVDPLNVMAHIHISLQEILAREVASSDTCVITVGQMAGGTVSNIIPDTAYLKGTIRTFDPEVREFAKKRLREISESVGKVFRANVTVEFSNMCPSMIGNAELTDYFLKTTGALVGKDNVLDSEKFLDGSWSKLAGSEDFAYIGEKVPSIMIMLGAGSKDSGYSYPVHHPKAIFSEKYLYRGSAVYVNMAIQWLKDNA